MSAAPEAFALTHVCIDLHSLVLVQSVVGYSRSSQISVPASARCDKGGEHPLQYLLDVICSVYLPPGADFYRGLDG